MGLFDWFFGDPNKAQADAARKQAVEFRRQASLIGDQSREVVKRYTGEAKGAMGDWILARSAAGMLDFADDEKIKKATEEIGGIKTEYDNPAKEAEFLTGAKSELSELLKKAKTQYDALSDEEKNAPGRGWKDMQLSEADTQRYLDLTGLIEGVGGNAAPQETISPLEQMKLASGSDLLSGVTFSRMLEYDRSMLVKKGQEDAFSMYQSGVNADAQAGYYDKASASAAVSSIFNTLLGGGMMILGGATKNPDMVIGGAQKAGGGIFG